MIDTAVILNAGLGSRLRPLTDDVPKCLTEVNGKRILDWQLDALRWGGIKNIIIVVGYLGEKIRAATSGLSGLNITFIENPDYEKTSSGHSAWLARVALSGGCYLIEGDIVFDHTFIRHLAAASESVPLWAASRCDERSEGAILVADEADRITDIRIVGSRIESPESGHYKSAGVMKIPADYGRKLGRWLEDAGACFKDEVIGQHLEEPVYLQDMDGAWWAEIDTPDDIRSAETSFPAMKYAVIILDGAADGPRVELGGKTPLEAAQMPALQGMARTGRVGLMRTIYPGLPAESIVAALGILGYNPLRYYPKGRASFEAVANDIYLDEGELAFRCNIIALDQDGRIASPSAHQIDDAKASELIEFCNANIKLGLPFRLHHGQGYRNILVMKTSARPDDLTFFPAHENFMTDISGLMPAGRGPEASALAGELGNMIRLSRFGTEDSQSLCLWPWSAAAMPYLPAFGRRHGLDGALISSMDFMRGIGIVAKMRADKVPGATGYADTNLYAKLRYAKNAFRFHDAVFIHINGTDEASHARDAWLKVSILERTDKELIGPLLEYMESRYHGRYRIAILSDHYTFTEDGTHGDGPVPYVIYGTGISSNHADGFSEAAAAGAGQTIKSYEFMDFLTGRGDGIA